jgi:creatinine amidohydrolase
MPIALKSRFWSDLSTLDFKRLGQHKSVAEVVAVLPVAATEQHGPHLPVSVDCDLIEGVVQASLGHLPNNLPVLFLPTQSIGKSNEHIRLTLSAHTLINLWMDIGASVARAGVKKLVLLNSHGGQVSVMDIVARDLRCDHDMLVFSTSWYNLPLGDMVLNQFTAAEHRFGIHAGDIETSMMLALRPDLVDMKQARNFTTQSQQRAASKVKGAALFPIASNGITAKLGWQMQDYNPMGAAGNASLATAVKGQALIDAAGKQLAALLAEISKMPLTALVDKPSLPK